MAESSDKIKERIKSGTLKSDPRPEKPKKRNIFYKIGRYYVDLVKILLGIDEDSIGKGRKTGPVYSERPSIRDTYRVDPPPPSHGRGYDPLNAVDRANVEAYLGAIDGRGDPKPCDCDHDR